MNLTGISAKHRNFWRSFQDTDINNIVIADPRAECASINAALSECKVLKDSTTATNNAANAKSGRHQT